VKRLCQEAKKDCNVSICDSFATGDPKLIDIGQGYSTPLVRNGLEVNTRVGGSSTMNCFVACAFNLYQVRH